MINLTPVSGPEGTYVTVTGKGYKRKESGVIDFGTLRVGSFRCNNQGSFSLGIRVPNLPPGTYIVRAYSPTVSSTTTFFIPAIVVPPTPPPPSTTADIHPGDDVQAKLSAAPEGATLIVADGTYPLTGFVHPRKGQTIKAANRRMAIFTGNDLYDGGISANGATGVTLSGLVVTHMKNSFPGSVGSVICGVGWKVDDCDISYSATVGLNIRDDCIITNNRIHHNRRYGFISQQMTYGGKYTFNNNEVDHNNEDDDTNDPIREGDSGAMKTIRSDGVVMDSNHIHDNYGNGIWFDWNNKNATITNNIVENNKRCGIFYEVSSHAVIRGNTVRGNMWGKPGKSIFNGSDIFLNDSHDVEIDHNTVAGSAHAIGLYDSYRDVGTELELKTTTLLDASVHDVSIHDNEIVIPVGGELTGQTGLVGDRAPAYSARNIWAGNIYRVTATQLCWRWNRGSMTLSQWQAIPQDISAVVLP